MKVVYIGTSDGLAETLAERMSQEGNDVYVLSDKDFSEKPKSKSLHRFYRAPRQGESFEKLLRSLSPDCVIFAGNHYISSPHEEEVDEDITLLAESLRTVSESPQTKFILLSSVSVYGNTGKEAEESAELAAASERGIRFLREERLLDIYRKQYDMDTIILRASQLYTNRAKEGEDDFLSRIFSAAVESEESLPADKYEPLHVSDFVDAIKRVADSGSHHVYNVSGSRQLSAKRLYQLVCQQEGIEEQPVAWEKPGCVSMTDSSRIRQELEWNDFRNLEKQIKEGEIIYERTQQKKKEKETGKIFPKPVRQVIENLVLFAIFFGLNYLFSSHDLFSQINWLMIYVILISVTYNVYQSALAAILASAAYLIGHNLSLLELDTYYNYADSVLAVMQFVFLGLVVSYTCSTLREENRSVRMDLKLLSEEYEDLKIVNDENVLIKNEYENRLLTTKTGFPKLYSMVSRLMVQEPDRILMETMQVISELINTDTVAVYKGQAGSPWLRLMGALSESSAMGGKTWNLSGSPQIYDAVARGELYQGEFGSEEPAVVLPIVCRDVPQAVLLIKKLPYESESLYHINLLKTMSLLLRDAMEKALDYEELSRDERYVEGTDILKPEAFYKRLLLAREEAEKNIAEYSVIELLYSGELVDAAQLVGHMLRVTDCLGIDDNGRLLALLNNTGPENLDQLQNRLLASGVEARLIPEELITLLGESTVA